jgi:hypothetical protein
MCLFFRALGHRHPTVFNPPPSLLLDTPTRAKDLELAVLLEPQRPLDGSKRIHVLHFDLGA